VNDKKTITRAAYVALGCAALTLAACSTSSTSTTSSSTKTPSATPSESASEQAKSLALTAYRGMWQDFAAAGENSDWQSAQLGRYSTGAALNNMHKALFADHTSGVVTKGEPVLSPKVDSTDSAANPTKITVKDCGDSTNWLKYRESDGQLADTPGGRRLIYADVQKQSDGSWKVSDYAVHDVGTC